MEIETRKATRKPDNALDGAALLALKKARMYGTKLAVQRNGRVELETPDEFEKHLPKDIR